MAHYNLNYLINHIFLPPKLPQSDDWNAINDHDMCLVVHEAAMAFTKNRLKLSDEERDRWNPVVRMLERLSSLYKSESYTKDQLENHIIDTAEGDVTALLVRAQNAGIIIRKMDDRTVFESFEVSPPNEVVMGNKGKLICSYPGPVIAVNSDRANDPQFIAELANFISQMNVDVFEDAMPTATKAGSHVVETRNTSHPRYITDLLTGILRGIGSPEEVPRIAKRIADDILWDNTLLPWRRSPLWLVIRVALQTSLQDPSNGSHAVYKSFMAFLMSKLLRKAVEAELESDKLCVMHKKVARRLYKIRDVVPSFVQSEVVEAGELAHALLQKRWEFVQKDYAHGLMEGWDPASLDIQHDTKLSLKNSRRYISDALKKNDQSSRPFVFQPNERARLTSLDQYSTKLLEKALKGSGETALYDFERAVEDGIDIWVSNRSLSNSTLSCSLISEWITMYSKEARSRYEGSPEQLSIMFLTLLELWIALDKLCTASCTLLLQYPPEVKEEFFTPLLLRRAKSIDRLKNAIQYLRKRQHNAIGHRPSIFSPTFTSSSFAVKYFDESSELQTLRARIERKAESDRRKKVDELNSQNRKYQNLQQQLASRSHEYNSDRTGQQTHKKKCGKCKGKKKLSSMSIEIHEWPLPSDESQAKGTVFELSPPAVFSIWRNTTYFFLRDVCTPAARREKTSTPKAQVELHKYIGLSSFAKAPTSSSSRCLLLASTTKTWRKTHYKRVKLPRTEDQVCLRNGLQLRLFDATNRIWISKPFDAVTISSECTFKLPKGPYSNLQHVVNSTAHTSNQIIASQSECSRDLSLHEYISFGTLRAGARLQWLNLLRELRARILTFSQEAVEMLIAQMALQMGPLSKAGRWEWHEELYDPVFQLKLLEELRDLKGSIRANWSEAASMRIIISLTRRVLIWCRDDGVIAVAHTLLDDARCVTYGWMKDVYAKFQDTNDSSQSSTLQRRLCEMAGTCRSTFDLDHKSHAATAEFGAPLNIMLEAGLILHDNLPANLSAENFPLITNLFALDRRLCHSFEPSLALLVKGGKTSAFSQAILQYWPAYVPGARWIQQPAPNNRWIFSESGNRRIAFNMMENELLINGKRLGRLPSEVMSHPMYSRILGQAILDVVPTDEFGAQFATKEFVCGYQLFFDLSPGPGKFVIKAKHQDTKQRYQLIPHMELSGDLPQFFVDDYTHWLDLDTGTIELRPLTSPWVSSSGNWHLEYFKKKPDLWRESSSGTNIRLIDIRSKTATMIADRLRGLETIKFLTISCSTGDLAVTIDVPRYRLSFRLDPGGHLSCLTLPGMIVDDNQSAGVMVGLQNRLVLRDKRCSTRRELLIPVGEISFSSKGLHASVAIDTGSQRRVSYHRYMIDDILGRIVENTGLHAKLYKIYLTALTSHCLPDPLTGRRGTEEALHELRSAGCRSFMQFDREARALLVHIGHLSPKRDYYPKHIRVMQTVAWGDLSFLNQSDMFDQAAQDILAFAAKLEVFGDAQRFGDISESRTKSETLLTERAVQRNSCYSPAELQPSRRVPDHRYVSRDVTGRDGSVMENLAFSFSTLITSRPSLLPTTPTLLRELGDLSKSTYSNVTSVSYTRYWMSKPLSETWLQLYHLLHGRSWWKKGYWYQILFTLCAIGCTRKEVNAPTLISTLIACAIHRKSFLSLPLSGHESEQSSTRFKLDLKHVTEVVWRCTKPFRSNDFADIIPEGSRLDFAQRRYDYYLTCHQSEVERATRFFMAHGRLQGPMPDGVFRIVDINRCQREIFPASDEEQMSTHFQQAQLELDRIRSSESFAISPDAKYTFEPNLSPRIILSSVSLLDLFNKRPTFPLESLPPLRPSILLPSAGCSLLESESDHSPLHVLIDSLRNPGGSVQSIYADDLHRSLSALQNETPRNTMFITSDKDLEGLYMYQEECQSHFRQLIKNIQRSLVASHDMELYRAGLYPHIELRSLLESIASIRPAAPPPEWITVLRHLARALLLYQRSRRLLRTAQLGKHDDLWRELEIDSTVLEVENCDWLLIQADSDFLARPIQLAVAREMISPSTEQNTLLQLNMGEGKSSVIVPVVAAAVADGRRLARVIVLKSLVGQMFSLLRQRLGGLTNRQILYLPFSRAVKIGNDEARQIREIFQYARETGAVLVAQPEHILSFKLMAINRLVEQDTLSKLLVETQLWLDKCSRDLLDESDEILHTRYQLVYTVGTQQMVEHGSERWKLIQQVLSLMRKCAPSIQALFPTGIDIGECVGNRFPSIRVLQDEAGAKLISEMLKHVMAGALESFYIERFSPRIRETVKSFIMKEIICDEDLEALRSHCSDTSLWKDLLLLRGLFGHGILVYTLKERRWRVDFGLDLSRSLLAVPYRAKDVPSLRAEFGHPDVAITLTCLSYLYGGLSQSELETCFQLLLKLDNPELEYNTWVHSTDVPEGLRSIFSINLQDSDQRRDTLFPNFRYNHACIDFYLSNVVFPKAMKEFPSKLATSGWDLACLKEQTTTGFSGTNENRYLLPTSISQVDTPERISTNAGMLVLLSRPENDWYMSPSTQNFSGYQIIDAIVDNPKGCDIRVLLDVGAQILEMSNVQVAEYWLSRRPDASAAVFFNEGDELEVMTRDGATEVLSMSPFHQHLDDCVVYLDDAHTRGTDLKLPTTWKACVTLGPKVTKDRLAQGCMRMRKLGHGQSVLFMAPPDIDAAIRKRVDKSEPSSTINSRDVLLWAMLETCSEIERHVPHWLQQAVDFHVRNEGWKAVSVARDPTDVLGNVTAAWLQPEARTLQDMYGSSPNSGSNELAVMARNIPEIRTQCEMLGIAYVLDPRLAEEQEREVNHELERETHIQRPPIAQPAEHSLHQRIRLYVESGLHDISELTEPFGSAFVPVRDGVAGIRGTAASTPIQTISPILPPSPAASRKKKGKKAEKRKSAVQPCPATKLASVEILDSANKLTWEPTSRPLLYATGDFLRTISATSSSSSCDYLRPLNWVLTSRFSSNILILSPYEVNEILPVIRKSNNVRLHMYTPRTIQTMKPTDDLQLYTIPVSPSVVVDDWPAPRKEAIDQLNLCAGQLYFSSYEGYVRTSAFLGLSNPENRGYEMIIEGDGFVKPENQDGRLRVECGFQNSPVPYLKALTGFRRRGMSFEPTHLGKILHGRLLRESDFDSTED